MSNRDGISALGTRRVDHTTVSSSATCEDGGTHVAHQGSKKLVEKSAVASHEHRS